MPDILISIITPCYNQGQYLDDAIESIAAINTPYTFEHIIINDGSTEALTITKLTELEAEGYNIIHQKKMGLASARNNAIALAKGKYILPLDADNKVHSNYLNEAIEILERNDGTDIVYGNAVLFGDVNEIRCPGTFDFTSVLKYNYIDACASFKKAIWGKTGGYDSLMPGMGNEDWDFWVSCFFEGAKFLYLNKECFYYRVSKDSMSATTTKPAFKQNKSYILKKHADKIFEYYELQMQQLKELQNRENFVSRHRFKAAAKLMLTGKI